MFQGFQIWKDYKFPPVRSQIMVSLSWKVIDFSSSISHLQFLYIIYSCSQDLLLDKTEILSLKIDLLLVHCLMQSIQQVLNIFILTSIEVIKRFLRVSRINQPFLPFTFIRYYLVFSLLKNLMDCKHLPSVVCGRGGGTIASVVGGSFFNFSTDSLNTFFDKLSKEIPLTKFLKSILWSLQLCTGLLYWTWRVAILLPHAWIHLRVGSPFVYLLTTMGFIHLFLYFLLMSFMQYFFVFLDLRFNVACFYTALAALLYLNVSRCNLTDDGCEKFSSKWDRNCITHPHAVK